MSEMNSSIPVWIRHLLHCFGDDELVVGKVKSRGCFGCDTKTLTVIDHQSKEFRVDEHTSKFPNVSDDFWSTSTYDLDTLTQSHRSTSSISTSTQTLSQTSASSDVYNTSGFVNHGLLLWNESRSQWIERGGRLERKTPQSRRPRLSWNATYEKFVGSKTRLSEPIPLSEMINFVVDMWEQEGLYD